MLEDIFNQRTLNMTKSQQIRSTSSRDITIYVTETLGCSCDTTLQI